MKKLLTIMIIGFAMSGSAQKNADKVINEFAEKVMSEISNVPGLGLAVVKDDQAVLVEGYGYADLDNDIKATGSTPFYIASITKSFMGMLASILENEGKIDFDAPLTIYKPFNNLKNKDLFKDVSVRELLNHTSGLDNDYITYRDAYTGDKSREIMEMLLEEVTEKKVGGKKYEYDNIGYNIFDILLKAEFGKDWRDLLEEKIFTPLEMNRTSAYISESEKGNWNMAWPYLGYFGPTPVRSDLMKNDDMMQAAGGLLCSARDAANWIEFCLNSGVLNGKKIYPADLVQRTLEPTATYEREGQIFSDNGYGIGWISASFGEEKVNYHFGGYKGFFSHISIMPEQNLGVAVFANEGMFGSRVANLIASFAYDYMLGNVASVDDYEDQIRTLKEQVDGMVGRMSQHIAKINAREWQLELPKEAYVGDYYNKYVGTIQLRMQDDELQVIIGQLKAVATAFTKANTMRIDLTGSGTVLSFKLEEGKVVQLDTNGDTFEKIN